MANRRMICRDVVKRDHFLRLKPSSQGLYMHLLLDADDDGFVGNPLAIVRYTSCTEEDMAELDRLNYILTFTSGVVVIRHWFYHNNIRKDRYRASTAVEKQYVTLSSEGVYVIKEECKEHWLPGFWNPGNQNPTPSQPVGRPRWQPKGNNLAPTWQPDGESLATEWQSSEQEEMETDFWEKSGNPHSDRA